MPLTPSSPTVMCCSGLPSIGLLANRPSATCASGETSTRTGPDGPAGGSSVRTCVPPCSGSACCNRTAARAAPATCARCGRPARSRPCRIATARRSSEPAHSTPTALAGASAAGTPAFQALVAAATSVGSAANPPRAGQLTRPSATSMEGTAGCGAPRAVPSPGDAAITGPGPTGAGSPPPSRGTTTAAASSNAATTPAASATGRADGGRRTAVAPCAGRGAAVGAGAASTSATRVAAGRV